MTVSDASAKAIASFLAANSALASTVDDGISASINDQFDNRVVVFSTQATLRHEHVKGIYDVSGQILVQQSADSENAETMFSDLCDEVRGLLEDKRNLPSLIESNSSALRVYTWNMNQQSANPAERGFQAVFEWQIYAELPN